MPDEAATDHIVDILAVIGLFLRRHPPPDWLQAGDDHRGAVKLVEQKIVLGTAAAFLGQVVLLPLPETVRVEDEKVDVQPQFRGPLFDPGRLLP